MCVPPSSGVVSVSAISRSAPSPTLSSPVQSNPISALPSARSLSPIASSTLPCTHLLLPPSSLSPTSIRKHVRSRLIVPCFFCCCRIRGCHHRLAPNIVVPAVVSDIKVSTYIRRRPSDSSDPHPGLCPARAMGYALEQTANLATQAAAPSSNFNFCRRHFVDPIS